MFKSIFDTPPTHTNELGVKWWLEKEMTTYAKSKKLKGVVVRVVQEPNGSKSYVITKGDNIVTSETALESVYCKLDVLAFTKKQRKK